MAARYAHAIFELANEQHELDKVAADLDQIDRSIADNPDLARLIASPVISREQQASAIAALVDKLGFADTTRKFLGVLAAKRRLYALPSMAAAFRDRLARQRGEVTAEVVSAKELDAKQVASLRDVVTSHTGKTVRLDTRVDPSLIGGLVLTVGSLQVDASLKRKLQQLDVAMRGLG